MATDYKGSPSRWLTMALDGCDVRVLNVKGSKADDTIVMLRLSKLEELLAAANENYPMEVDTPHEMHG